MMRMAAAKGVEDSMDLVLDLQHDLGKYIRMPLAYLPRDASPAEVHEALQTALLRTRRSAVGSRSARTIWESFLHEIDGSVRAAEAFGPLADVVERALRWEAVATQAGAVVDRERAERELSAVLPAIRALAQELDGRA
jgi:hypothetical protein